MPYGLDNGAFGAFKNGQPFDVAAWEALLDWTDTRCQKPLWVLVPDVVQDRAGTIAAWPIYRPIAARIGRPLAFAVQDGMEARDVPADADVVFIGGSIEWKMATLVRWCREFPRVHVGRINTYDFLVACDRAGAESCDGTGWFRGNRNQTGGLVRWLAEATGQTLSSFADIGEETANGFRLYATKKADERGADWKMSALKSNVRIPQEDEELNDNLGVGT